MRTPLPKVAHTRVLVDWVTESIREAILIGHFDPGEKLDQELIAQELEISRTPVREALSKLESEGLIEVRPHRGAFVMLPSREDIKDVYEVLAILETEVVRQVTASIPDSVLDEMDQRLVYAQASLTRRGGTPPPNIDFPRFFAPISEFSQNALLKEIMAGLNQRIDMLRRLARLQPESYLGDSFGEHRAILEAIRQRDADRAAAATRSHLERSGARLLSLMR